MDKNATLFIVSAPSGGGKTSLARAVAQKDTQLKISISFTTRPKRPGEEDGKDYNFVSEEEFWRLEKANTFLEYAKVFNYHYATSRTWISEQLAQGIDVILDIDWQGAQQLKLLYQQCVTIFVLPPSLEVLAERLSLRGQDSQDIIQQRMAKAQSEMSHYHEYDYIIINREFLQAEGDLLAIIQAERLRLSRQQQKHAQMLKDLVYNG